MIMIELSGRGHLPATPLGVRQFSKRGWGSRKSCQEKNHRKIYNIHIQVTYNSLIIIQRYMHISLVGVGSLLSNRGTLPTGVSHNYFDYEIRWFFKSARRCSRC